MTESVHLRDILVLLLAAVAVVPLFRRLQAGAVLGYLVAGALIGPHGLELIYDAGAVTVPGPVRRGLSPLLHRPLAVDRAAHRPSAPGLRTGLRAGTRHRRGAVPHPARRRGRHRAGAGPGRRSGDVVHGGRAAVAHRAAGAGHAARAASRSPFSSSRTWRSFRSSRCCRCSAYRDPGVAGARRRLVKAAATLAVILLAGRLLLRPLLRSVTRGGSPSSSPASCCCWCWDRVADRAGRALDGPRRLPRRRPDGRDGIPPPGRG